MTNDKNVRVIYARDASGMPVLTIVHNGVYYGCATWHKKKDKFNKERARSIAYERMLKAAKVESTYINIECVRVSKPLVTWADVKPFEGKLLFKRRAHIPTYGEWIEFKEDCDVVVIPSSSCERIEAKA